MSARIAEPMSAPASHLGAVLYAGTELTEVHGTTASGLVKFILRFYFNAMAEPVDQTEKTLAQVSLKIMDDLAGGYDLGDASVRNIVPLNLSAPPGFQTIGNTMYRLADLAVDVMVNDLVTFAATGFTAPAYTPACTLTANIVAGDLGIFYTSTGDPIAKWDIIQIDSELMVVIVVGTADNSLNIGRGYNGTTAAAHTAGAAILRWGQV